MPEQPNGGDRRVTDLKFERINERLTDLQGDLNEGINQLRNAISNLNFVPMGVYEADKRTQAAENKRIESVAESARSTSWWALGVIIVIVLGAIFTALARIAGIG